MIKNVWCAPMLLAAFGCAHPSQAGNQKPEEGAPIACTQIGCIDGLFVELKSPNAAWAAGSYTLDLKLGEQVHACPFVLPRDLPQPGHVGQVECTPATGAAGEPVQAMINQEAVCTEQVTENAVSSTCEPVPDRYAIQLSIPGTPSSVTLDLKRDGVSLIARTYEPKYEESRPNGPQCEPLCRQGRIEENL